MEFKKVLIYGFFGVIGAIILSLLSAVGGVGAGISLLVISLGVNVLVGSLIGGVTAAAAFHTLIKGVDSFLVKAAEEKGKKAGTPVNTPPSLAQDRRYLWGSVSFFFSTVVGVNLIQSLISNPTWGVIATIIGSGLLGLAGLALVVKLKLWNPDFKQKEPR